jgi:hypothetical protein
MLMDPIKIVRESVEARGGLDYWNSLEALEAEISAGGRTLHTCARNTGTSAGSRHQPNGEPCCCFSEITHYQDQSWLS